MKRNYYLFEVKNIRRKDNTLQVEKFDSKKISIPIKRVDDLYVFSTMTFNTKFLDFISQNNICMHTFNHYGYYSGTYYPREKNISGRVLLAQVKYYNDEIERLKIAREIIDSASLHIYRNLRYYNERGKDFDDALIHIKGMRNDIKYAENINQLMGIEGNIRKKYYQCWTEIFGDKFELTKRVRRPPDNVVNTMISFVNSIVYTTVLSEIYKTQLNPTISYLHEPGTKRFSLALDLSEIFKPIIVDRLIFSLINKKVIDEQSFVDKIEFLYIKEKERKNIIKEIDAKFNTTIMHKKLRKKVSYKYLIRLEAYKLIKTVLNNEKYESFKIWW